MRRCVVLGSLCLVLSLSPLVRSVRADDESLRQRVLSAAIHGEDDEVRRAAALLMARGVLDGAEAAPAAPRGLADCSIVLRQAVLESSFARELLATQLTDKVMDLTLTFVPGGVRAQGTLDGPLFVNPKFQAFVGLRMVQPNTFDVVIERAAVLGFDLKRFTGVVFRSLEATLSARFGSFYRLEDRGRQEDGSYVLRCSITPAGFVPIVGNQAFLHSVLVRDGEVEFGVSLR